jgi:hypothetical protein
MLYLAELDNEINKKREKNKESFNLEDFQTPAERMEELKRILVAYKMDMSKFEGSHKHSAAALYRNFISNVPDPYL